MMKKKIVLFSECVYPDNNAGSVRAHYLIQALKKIQPNLDIVIITGTQDPTPQLDAEFISVNNAKSYKKIGFIKRAINELWLGARAVQRLFIIRKCVDLVYISSPSYLAAVVLATYSILARFKYVFEVRDIYPEAFSYAGAISQNGLMFKLFSFLSNKTYRNSELIICATNGIEKMIQVREAQATTLTALNGFPSSLLSISNKKYERFTLVFHGTLGVFQDIELLCELSNALKVYDDIDLIVIGHGVKSELVKDAAVLNPNLQFLGSLDHHDTLDVVSKCHVGLSFRSDDPLSIISFPVKTWEYLGLAIPSIITPHGSEAGQFLEGNSCAVQIKSKAVKDILEVILRFRSDESFYRVYESGCEKSRHIYTREVLAGNLAKELLDRINSCV